MPLFEELRQTSQDFCELDIDPHRSWDVCPNSPKSGKSILIEKVATICLTFFVRRCTQVEPKMVPCLPRSPQATPKSTPEEPKSLPRGPQEHPKGAQESPKTLSEPWSDQKRRFFRIRRMSELKSMILRVRGSSWELQIDPERVEEENKHV